MRKKYLWGFALAALAGTGLHFLYPLCPMALVGLFAPVDESVWEHLKLLYWPFLTAAAILTRSYPPETRLRAWSGFLLSLLLQPLALTGSYYLLSCGLGAASLVLDIALYYLTLAGGFYLAGRLARSGAAEPSLGLLIVLAAVYGVSLAVFTLAAPNLPIFISD